MTGYICAQQVERVGFTLRFIRRVCLHRLLAVIPILLPAALQAQPSFDVVPHARLSTAAGPILPSLSQFVIAQQTGEFVVSYYFRRPPQLVRYDSSGTMLQLYDLAGEGPGEFLYSPLIFAGRQDTVYAFEKDRLVRLNRQLEHIETRKVEVPPVRSLAILAAGMMISDYVSGDERGTNTVTLVSPEGRVVRRLETEPGTVVGWTLVAPASNGGFWTLRPNGSRLRRYSAAAVLERSVDVASDWFLPWTERIEDEGRSVSPRPRHVGIHDVGDEKIVLLSWVADTEWTAQPVAPTAGYNPLARDLNLYYDTIVELIDGRSGRVLQKRRFAEAFATVSGPGNFVYSAFEDSDGHAVTRIWKVTVRN